MRARDDTPPEAHLRRLPNVEDMNAGGSPSQAEVRWRDVAMPTEHGGWSFTLEPALLGLLAQPSVSGVALAAAALLGFLVRVPLKTVLVDRRRGRRLPRTRLAARASVVYGALLALAGAVAVFTAAGDFWVPLALAAPLVALELWYDARSRSRRLVPELAGTVAIGSVGSAIVLAGGGSAEVAAGVWLVAGVRAVAAVPYVRVQLRRRKGQAHRWLESDLGQAAASVVILVGWLAGPVPGAAMIAVCGLALVHVVMVRLPPPRVAVLGAQQVVFGLAVVVASGLGFRAP